MTWKLIPIKIIYPIMDGSNTIGRLRCSGYYSCNWFADHINAVFFFKYWIFLFFHNFVFYGGKDKYYFSNNKEKGKKSCM